MIGDVISDRNLEQNKYEYKGNFGSLYIMGKDDYRLLLEPVKNMPGYYSIFGNYLFKKPHNFERRKLYDGIQLDLFENKPVVISDDLELMINLYAW